MIKFEDARMEIAKANRKEASKQIKSVMEEYNIYIVNGNDPIAVRKNKNMNNLVWYMDLSGNLMSRSDLFDDVKKELETEGYILAEEEFKQIDKYVNLSRFDYPSAFHIVCKKVRETANK